MTAGPQTPGVPPYTPFIRQGASVTGSAEQLGGRVWRVRLPHAPPFILKLSGEAAGLRGETMFLGYLAQNGCAVPRVLADAPGSSPAWLVLEDCGITTLDRVLQEAPARRATVLAQQLARCLAHVERAMLPFTMRFQSEQREQADRKRALRRQTAPWQQAAPEALEWLLDRAMPPLASSALEQTIRCASQAEPDVGSVDYNASNVVLHRSRLTIVDWPAIGLDWPERRFVQYGTATGVSGGAHGTFASAITNASVRTYAELAAAQREAPAHEIAQTVDAHDVLLLLTAATSLRMVANGTADPDRAAAWSNVAERRQRLCQLLARRVWPDSPAERFRAQIRRLT